jgi:hypothetical protein
MGTQTNIARAIREGGGDYCLSLKENWPAVHAEVEQFFNDPCGASAYRNRPNKPATRSSVRFAIGSSASAAVSAAARNIALAIGQISYPTRQDRA